MMGRIRLLLASFLALSTFVAIGAGSASAFDLFGDPCSNPKADNATVCQEADKPQTPTNNSLYGPNGIITKVVNLLSIIIGVAAVIVIIIAGIQYMISTGDSTKVNNAKNAILYAVIGLVVAVIAQGLVIFVIKKIT